MLESHLKTFELPQESPRRSQKKVQRKSKKAPKKFQTEKRRNRGQDEISATKTEQSKHES